MTEGLIELTDVVVDRIGLVRRPAGRSPSGDASTFYFVKSEDGQPEPEDGGEPMSDQTNAPEGGTEDYAEQLAQAQAKYTELEEKFSASEEAREKLAEDFAEERRKRRLAEFTEKVTGFSFAAEIEQFAEDLLALEDYDAELHSRWMQRLNALDEQVKSGKLFEQMSAAETETEGGDPFEAKVESIRKERFSDKEYEEGYAEALDIAQKQYPELAAEYARR